MIVRDLQQKQFTDFDSEVLSSNIDEVSLNNLRSKLDESTLNDSNKDLVKQIVDLVSDQSRYMGHSDKQDITF